MAVALPPVIDRLIQVMVEEVIRRDVVVDGVGTPDGIADVSENEEIRVVVLIALADGQRLSQVDGEDDETPGTVRTGETVNLR
jgi:hypothetical protein